MYRVTGSLFAVLLLTGSALGNSQTIRDTAKFFSDEAEEKAAAAIRKIKAEHGLDVVVETFEKPSSGAEVPASSDPKTRNSFFARWAEERARTAKVQGVYVLICKEPAHLKVAMRGPTTSKAFATKDRDLLAENFVSHFKKGDFDLGLLTSVAKIDSRLASNKGSARELSVSSASSSEFLSSQAGSSSIWTWVTVAGVVVIGFLIVRMLMGASAGGGGGGGILTSLLGGLAGAAAGMWLYDSFFGNNGSAHSDSAQVPGHDDYSSTGSDFGGESGGEF